MPIEINRKLKDLSKSKEDGLRDITSKQLLAVISALENISKLAILYSLTPLLILEENTTLEEQTINSSVL